MLRWRAVQRQYYNSQVIAGMASVMSGQDVALPDLEDVQDAFDEALRKPPEQGEDLEKIELKRAMGLTGR